MTLQELQKQALQLSITDRRYLADLLLSSVQQESHSFNISSTIASSLAKLDPWTQSLIGLIQFDTSDPTDSYVDYLEEKYS